ncbi:4-(cytidine 5'-diphospho)-2-C-methyl-D-erythritol kinase [Micrococcoides hystricis]|uniref:4-diphosphocytidyl-2-C-methyl-D-erythritol kinase n=1 Tax=Micrococcoides hystricis TaxID=1572761 RepID=A0ABV6PB34_9MICC
MSPERQNAAELFGYATANAPGKINIALHVGAPRADGYHELQTLFLAVNCAEQVRATSVTDGSITAEFSSQSASHIAYQGLPTDESNLAVKAALLLQREFNIDEGAHLTITKNVPIAGGMGGGSADAAAALVACAALWGIQMDRRALAEFAEPLGADVPFAVLGGAALGAGIGHELTPLLTTAQTHWVIVPATGNGLSTPSVYKEFDQLHGYRPGQNDTEPEPISTELLRAFAQGDPRTLAGYLRNDLQPATLALYPELSQTLELGLREGALATMISGSGPTIMMLCDDAEAASALALRLNDEYQLPAWPVTGPAAGATIC